MAIRWLQYVGEENKSNIRKRMSSRKPVQCIGKTNRKQKTFSAEFPWKEETVRNTLQRKNYTMTFSV